MAGLKKKRRIQLIIAGFLCIIAGFTAVYYAAGDALQYFYSPTDLVEKKPPLGRVIRIGGLVEEGSIVKSGETIDFRVTDGKEIIAVRFVGIPPPLFREGQGTVATGKLTETGFVATEILAKHDETYMPKEVADALKEQGVFKPEQD